MKERESVSAFDFEANASHRGSYELKKFAMLMLFSIRAF